MKKVERVFFGVQAFFERLTKYRAGKKRKYPRN